MGRTTCGGGVDEFIAVPFAALAGHVAAGTLSVTLGRTFRLGQIVQAHRALEENRAGGKIGVLP